MYAAPFKQSNVEGAVRVPLVDGTALRKESWKLGSSPQIYETINQSNYGVKGESNYDSKANKAAIHALKSKVAGSSIGHATTDGGSLWKSTSANYHKDLGRAERPDANAARAMKQKLTQTNFGMGDAKVGYHTTNQTNHSPMKGDYFTKD